MRRLVSGAAGLVLLASVSVGVAQKKSKDNQSGYDRSAKATLLHQAVVYVSADGDSQRVSLVTPGHEVVVVERNGAWAKVFANTDVADKTDDSDVPELSDEDNVTPASGWIRDKGVVSPATPNGDAILFGAATSLEEEAEQPHAPKDAAVQAHLLYRRVAEYYPTSPLAAEAAWRSADVRWRLEKIDVSTLPSAKEQEAYLRPQIYEGDMKRLIKQYPGTKYAAMAAFTLIDNKLCGDWQGLPKCPEMESSVYEKYAKQFPGGVRSDEALYDATYRQGVLVSMYMVDENKKKSDVAAERTKELAAEMQAEYPKSDYTARAASIAYKVGQGIAIFGNDRD